MGIRDIVLPVEKVAVGEGFFLVRGLSLTDITPIINAHFPVVASLFQQFTADLQAEGPQTEKGLGERIGSAGRTILQDAPEVVVEIITAALDDEDRDGLADIVRRLPIPAQMEALEKIGRLTFTSEAVVGKTLEMVIAALETTTNTVAAVTKSPSSPGSGAFAGR